MSATRPMLPMILIVEDSEDLQELYKFELNGNFVILQATTNQEADSLYKQFKECLFAVVFDGYLGEENSLDLARKIRADRYTGEMIANSSHHRLQDMLVEAGCRRNESKADLPQLLISLALLPEPRT